MMTPEELAEKVIASVEQRFGAAGEPERAHLKKAIAMAVAADRRAVTSSPEAIATLTAHHRKPVLPIEQYCAAMETWFKVFHNSFNAASGEGARNERWALRWVLLSIKKSNLLYRLIYLGEKLRTTPCSRGPGHGSAERWSCGCDGTGWLPES